MKKLNKEKLTAITGGGCGKYLRKAQRAWNRGEDHVGDGYGRQYLDCVGYTGSIFF